MRSPPPSAAHCASQLYNAMRDAASYVVRGSGSSRAVSIACCLLPTSNRGMPICFSVRCDKQRFSKDENAFKDLSEVNGQTLLQPLAADPACPAYLAQRRKTIEHGS